MKYARRSVSDQDIRRYELFAQVRNLPHNGRQCFDVASPHRTSNKPGRLDRRSSSRKLGKEQQQQREERVKGLERFLRTTTICTHDGQKQNELIYLFCVSNSLYVTSNMMQ